MSKTMIANLPSFAFALILMLGSLAFSQQPPAIYHNGREVPPNSQIHADGRITPLSPEEFSAIEKECGRRQRELDWELAKRGEPNAYTGPIDGPMTPFPSDNWQAMYRQIHGRAWRLEDVPAEYRQRNPADYRPGAVSTKSAQVIPATSDLAQQLAAERAKNAELMRRLAALAERLKKIEFRLAGGNKQTGHYYDPYMRSHVWKPDAPLAPTSTSEAIQK